jgi:hypothetical protein
MIDWRVAEISGGCMIDLEVRGWGEVRVGKPKVTGRSYGVGVETPKYLPYPVPTA